MKPGQASQDRETWKHRARWLKAMAHPERLRILDALRREESCVCHLETLLNRPQPYVSQQLRVLRETGIVRSHRVGTHVFYFLADPKAFDVLKATLGPIRENEVVFRFPGCRCPKCQEETGALEEFRLRP